MTDKNWWDELFTFGDDERDAAWFEDQPVVGRAAPTTPATPRRPVMPQPEAAPGEDTYQPDVPFDPLPQSPDRTGLAGVMGNPLPDPEPRPEPVPLADLGSRVARGATEVGASLPESLAIAGAGNPNASALFAQEEVLRAREQIALAEARLSANPDMSQEDRARIATVIAEERAKIEAYQPLVDIAEGPLRPAPSERPLYQRGDAIREASQALFGTPDPQFDDRFISKLAEGAGSFAGFVGAALLTGPVGGAAAGSSVNASGMYRRALADGASEEQARAAAYIGSVVGLSEAVPIAGALRMLPAPLRDKATTALGRRLSNAFITAGEEGLQEALVGVANNLTEKGIWNPEQSWSENIGEDALIGAILGGSLGAIAPTGEPVGSPGPTTRRGPDEEPPEVAGLTPPPLPPATPAPLTAEDRASPVPDREIAEGRGLIDEILRENATISPAQPGDGIAPLPTPGETAVPRTEPSRMGATELVPMPPAPPQMSGLPPAQSVTRPPESTGPTGPTPEQRPDIPEGAVPADVLFDDAPQAGPTDPTGPTPAPTPTAADPEGRYIEMPDEEGNPGRFDTQTARWEPLPAATAQETDAPTTEDVQPQAQEPVAVEVPAAVGDDARPAEITPTREGRADIAVTPSGKSVNVRYAVVEASQLTTSNVAGGAANRSYPKELQPRDRTRGTSQEQVRRIAQNLNPRLLGENPSATDGAPIISRDGIVESGNGRTLAIQQAYEQGGAEAYRQYLQDQGYDVAGMERPVLVRIRQDEMSMEERAAFARDANERTTAAMSSTERAMADANAMPDSLMGLYRGGDIDAAGNRDFVRGFIQSVVSASDQAQMIDASGAMSQDAVRRVQGALLARAYGDANLVAALMEASDGHIKAIGGALMDVAASWAQMRQEARNGTIAANMDQTEALLEAVRVVDRARRDRRNVAEFVGQGDLLAGDSISPMGQDFLALMFRNVQSWTQPAGRDKIAQALTYYVEQARETQAGADMFGASADPAAVVQAAKQRQYDNGQDGQGDLLTQARSQPGDGDGAGVRADGAGRDEPRVPQGSEAEGAAGARAGGEEQQVDARPPQEDPARDTGGAGTPAGREAGAEDRGADAVADEAEGAGNAATVKKLNRAIKAENKDGTGFYVSGSLDVQLDISDGDVKIELTESRSRYRGRAKETRSNTTSVLYSEVRRDLSPAARAEIDAYLAEDAEEAARQFPQDLTEAIGKAKSFKAKQNAADRWVLKQGKAEGVEYVVILDKSGNVIDVTGGTRANVDPGPAAYEAAAEGRIGYATHNHPASSGFSVPDIRMLAIGFGPLVAIGHRKGSRHVAEQGFLRDVDRADDSAWNDLTRALQRVDGQVRAAMQERVNSRDLDVDAASATHAILFGRLLDRIGAIKYSGDAESILATFGVDENAILDGQEDAARERFRWAGYDVPDPAGEGRDLGAGGTGRADADAADGTGPAADDPAADDGSGRVSGPEGLEQPSFARSQNPAFWDMGIDPRYSESAFGGRVVYETTPEFQEQARLVAGDLRTEARKLGLPNIDIRVSERIFGSDGRGGAVPIDGLQVRDLIMVALDSGRDAMATMRHEVIHALRNPDLWGKEFGLFRPAEWRALERAAAADTERMAESERDYPGRGREVHLEETIARMFEDWSAGRYEATGFVAAAFRAIRNAIEAIGNALRGNGFTTVDSVFRKVASGAVGRRQGADRGRGRAEPPVTGGRMARAVRGDRGAEADAEVDTFAADFLAELAAVDDLYAYPRSTKRDVGDMFADVAPDVQYKGEMSPADVTADAPDAERHLYTTGSGADFYVYRTEDEVWFDVSRLKEGDGGNALYAGLADYAHNSGRVFIGDPEGLSDIALRRRTDAMLSSALKWGTTDHLAPHERQRRGDEALGIPPLAWQAGNWQENVTGLIEVSVANVAGKVPEVRDARYDFNTATFRDAEGAPITDADFRGWAVEPGGVREAGAGVRTLKRTVLLNTVLRTEGGARPGLLEQALRQSRKLVDDGLTDVFYALRGDDLDLSDPDVQFAVRRVFKPSAAANIARQTNTPHIPDRRLHNSLFGFNRQFLRQGLSGALSDGLDRIRIWGQDQFLAVRRAEEAIERMYGTSIPKSQSAYYAEERYSGRVGRRLEAIDERYTRPIIKLIAKQTTPFKLTDKDGNVREGKEAVNLFLWARHALERNRQIAKINDQMQDGGSGLTDAEANAILAEARNLPGYRDLERIGKLTDRLGREMIDLRKEAGLLSPQEALIWRTQYKHYVPLKGFAETDMYDAIVNENTVPRGRKFNVRGKEDRQALGRATEAFDPLATLLTQAQEVSIRAEKNLVARTLHNLVSNNPAPAMWEVKTPQTERYFNKATGRVETRVVGAAAGQLGPNEMALKIDGKEHRIVLHDPRLARALGKLGTSGMEDASLAMRAVQRFGQWFSMANTMLNPEFVITNAFRDMQTAQINLQGFVGKQDIAAISKAAITTWPKALMGSYRAMSGKRGSQWAQHFRDYEAAGGKVSFWRIDTPEAGGLDLERRIRRESGSRAARALKSATALSIRDNAFLNWMDRANLAVDNAVRLAVFVEARNRGWSKEDAASLAKNLTVNFNRKGEAGSALNSFYVFFNAAVQGNMTMLRAMKNNPKRMGAIVGALVVNGVLSDLLNAWQSEEDDDGELEYDKIAHWKMERNIIVPDVFGLGDGDDFGTIPMPWGYNVFHYAGVQIGKVARGVKDPGAAFSDVARATFAAFSPISDQDWARTIAPTIGDLGLDLVLNEDWTGKPIRPEPAYADYGPQSFREWNASEAAVAASRGMNYLTGGSMVEAGAIDISPEYIDHVTGFLGGGALRFAGRTADLAGKVATGQAADVEMYQIPFARVLVTETADFLDRNRYYMFREVVNSARAMDKRVKENDTTFADAARNPERLEAALSLYDDLRRAEKRRRDLDDKLDAIYADDTLTERERSEKLRPVQDKLHEVYMDFNGRFIEVMGPQAE